MTEAEGPLTDVHGDETEQGANEVQTEADEDLTPGQDEALPDEVPTGDPEAEPATEDHTLCRARRSRRSADRRDRCLPSTSRSSSRTSWPTCSWRSRGPRRRPDRRRRERDPDARGGSVRGRGRGDPGGVPGGPPVGDDAAGGRRRDPPPRGTARGHPPRLGHRDVRRARLRPAPGLAHPSRADRSSSVVLRSRSVRTPCSAGAAYPAPAHGGAARVRQGTRGAAGAGASEREVFAVRISRPTRTRPYPPP